MPDTLYAEPGYNEPGYVEGDSASSSSPASGGPFGAAFASATTFECHPIVKTYSVAFEINETEGGRP